MINYIKGGIKNLFNPAVSVLAVTDDASEINRLAKINRFAKVVKSRIGRYSYLGIGSWAVNADIGSFCSIANGVNIGLAEHTLTHLSSSPIFTEKHNGTGHSWTDKDFYLPHKRTVIGNDVWIGYRALVRGGVSVGNGAVIGAGAVVTKDIPPYAIVGGIPAKVIRFRFSEDTIKLLEELKWWEIEDEMLKKNISLFQRPLEDAIDDLPQIRRGGVKLLYSLESFDSFGRVEERRAA